MSVNSFGKSSRLSTPLINNVWSVGRKIGAGSYGMVCLATHAKTKKVAAVKLEQIRPGNILRNEYEILNSFAGKPGFPEVYYYGTYRKVFNCMVMQMLGRSLEATFEKCGRHFTIKALVFLVTQLIRRFQTIHSMRIVYRDVKPENFLLGQNSNRVHVIDFGLSKYYANERGEHVSLRSTREIIGTSRYMSINAHKCQEASRRDDMESLAYVMVYFMRGSLPWSGLKLNSFSAHNQRIMELKRDISPEVLCKGYPEEFLNFYKQVRSLSFTEKPDYQGMVNMFKHIYRKLDITNDGKYDWNHL